MKKIIKIDGKEYTMKSSAFTQFAYRDLTNRSLLKDLQTILDKKDEIEKDLSIADGMIELLLDVAFVMVQEADDSQYKTKEEFFKSIDSLYNEEDNWINDVLSLAINPLSRQLQNNKK